MQITEIFCYQAKITPDCIFEKLSSRHLTKMPIGGEGREGKAKDWVQSVHGEMLSMVYYTHRSFIAYPSASGLVL